MRIITVNLPENVIKAIDGLTGLTGLYPSRSELIRVAVRDFLIDELKTAKAFANFYTKKEQIQKEVDMLDPNLFVRIPVGTCPVNGEPEFKTFRIVKR